MNTLQVSNGLIGVQTDSASRCNSLITWSSILPMTWAGALLAAILLAGSGPSASAQQKVGYVLQMEGTWKLDGASQPLAMGQALPGGALLLNAAPQDEDNIVVADLKGEIIKTVRCCFSARYVVVIVSRDLSGAGRSRYRSTVDLNRDVRPPDREIKTTKLGFPPLP